MKKATKIIIIIALILALIRIINPVMVQDDYEADPLFDNGDYKTYIIDRGKTSTTNLIHIFYIILFTAYAKLKVYQK